MNQPVAQLVGQMLVAHPAPGGAKGQRPNRLATATVAAADGGTAASRPVLGPGRPDAGPASDFGQVLDQIMTNTPSARSSIPPATDSAGHAGAGTADSDKAKSQDSTGRSPSKIDLLVHALLGLGQAAPQVSAGPIKLPQTIDPENPAQVAGILAALGRFSARARGKVQGQQGQPRQPLATSWPGQPSANATPDGLGAASGATGGVSAGVGTGGQAARGADQSMADVPLDASASDQGPPLSAVASPSVMPGDVPGPALGIRIGPPAFQFVPPDLAGGNQIAYPAGSVSQPPNPEQPAQAETSRSSPSTGERTSGGWAVSPDTSSALENTSALQTLAKVADAAVASAVPVETAVQPAADQAGVDVANRTGARPLADVAVRPGQDLGRLIVRVPGGNLPALVEFLAPATDSLAGQAQADPLTTGQPVRSPDPGFDPSLAAPTASAVPAAPGSGSLGSQDALSLALARVATGASAERTAVLANQGSGVSQGSQGSEGGQGSQGGSVAAVDSESAQRSSDLFGNVALRASGSAGSNRDASQLAGSGVGGEPWTAQGALVAAESAGLSKAAVHPSEDLEKADSGPRVAAPLAANPPGQPQAKTVLAGPQGATASSAAGANGFDATANAERIAAALGTMGSQLQGRSGGVVRLHLDPPGLGEMRVEMSLNSDSIRVTLLPSAESTAQLLTGQLHQLRDGLESRGLVVASLSVEHPQGIGQGGQTGQPGQPHGGSAQDRPAEQFAGGGGSGGGSNQQGAGQGGSQGGQQDQAPWQFQAASWSGQVESPGVGDVSAVTTSIGRPGAVSRDRSLDLMG